jgi:hypothetical protein
MLDYNDFMGDGWKDFLEELRHESDRGAAIVGVAYLDDLIRQCICAYLKLGTGLADELAGDKNPLAPLGTFASRVVAAHALGLVRDNERKPLKTIRLIRNRFAHDLGLTFEQAPISGLCATLKKSKGIELTMLDDTTPRLVFESCVSAFVGKFSAMLNIVGFGLNGDFPSVVAMAALLDMLPHPPLDNIANTE